MSTPNSFDEQLRQQQQQQQEQQRREEEARRAASANQSMQIGSWPFQTYGAAQTQWTNNHK